MIYAIIIMSALIIVLFYIITMLYRAMKSEQTKFETLNRTLENYQLQIKSMTDYISELKKIKIDEDNFQHKLSEAENEEDIFAVINGIVNANNSKLQNDKDKGSSGSSTKTTKNRKTGSNKS